MATTVVLFGIALFASIAGAISGIGGGVIIKPVLDAVTNLSVTEISFLSGCTVLSMAVVSMVRNRKQPTKIESGRGTMLAVGAAIGGIAGKCIFDVIKTAFSGDKVVGATQSALLIIITMAVFIFVRNKGKITNRNVGSRPACIFVGLTLGMLSAFLGIGGGPINIAVLTYLLSMDSKTAALHSLYIILFSQAASFILTFATRAVPETQPVYLFAMIAGGIAGGMIGSAVLRRVNNRMVDNIFCVIMILVIVISSINFLKFIQM